MANSVIKTNSDFLFLYEAVKCNPNGDPDMENKPRIDYETKTNLVTDLRLKRYIREYLKIKKKRIFVDTLAEKRVTADRMLNTIIAEKLANPEQLTKLFDMNPELKQLWEKLTNGLKVEEKNYEAIKKIAKKKSKKGDKNESHKFIQNNFVNFNNLLLNTIIKAVLVDIRFFGGAFAIEDFTQTYTGPIQINWGYSLHPVELIKTNTITTRFASKDDMEMGSMGKDYRLYYSLLAFHGTINKNAAQRTGLTQTDLSLFREAVVQAIPALPTRSKLGQYPILFMQVEYKEDYQGYLRDLRDFIDVRFQPEKAIRRFTDLDLNLVRLKKVITRNADIIKKLYIWKTPLIEKIVFTDWESANLKIETLNFSIQNDEA